MKRLISGLILLLAITGCGSAPPVKTSTGAVVPAATVIAQDAAADVLSALKVYQRGTVAEYEARKATLEPEERARQYRVLTRSADALDASWAALVAWKKASAAPAPIDVLRAVLDAAPEFLDLAVSLDVVSRAAADRVLAILKGGAP